MKSLFCADIFRGNIRGPLIWQIAIGSEIDFRRNLGSRVQGPSRMSTVYALTYPPAVFLFPNAKTAYFLLPPAIFGKRRILNVMTMEAPGIIRGFSNSAFVGNGAGEFCGGN